MSARVIKLAAAAFLATLATSVTAQDEATDSGSSDDAETESLLAYLGLTAASGKTTVGDNAGSMEAFILTTLLMRIPINEFLEELDEKRKNEKEKEFRYLVVANDARIDLSPYSQVKTRVDLLFDKTREFLNTDDIKTCLKEDTSVFDDGALEPFGITEASLRKMKIEASNGQKAFEFNAADFVGFLRSDTDIKAVSVDLPSDLFVNGLITRNMARETETEPKHDLRVWSEIAKPLEEPSFTKKLKKIDRALAKISSTCAAGESERAKRITKQLTPMRTSVAAFSKPGKDGTPSPLQNAERIAGAFEGKDSNEVKILRLTIHKSGGTLINNGSIWTTLGIPGVTVRAGLVASYRVINPATGQIENLATRVCAFPKKALASVAALSKFSLNDKGKCVDPLNPYP